MAQANVGDIRCPDLVGSDDILIPSVDRDTFSSGLAISVGLDLG